MSRELVSQAETFFSDREQWYSFLELMQSKDEIRNAWFQKLKIKMNECFAKENLVDKWSYTSWGTWEYRWFISDFGKESVCLYFTGGNTLHLWANGNLFDVVKLSLLVQSEKYIPVVSAFERPDEIPEPTNWSKIIERGNFRFGDEYDGSLDADKLAWFSNYEPEKVLEQLVNKIDKFRKNIEVTELLIELNKATKKAT